MVRNLRKMFSQLNEKPPVSEGLFDFVEAGPFYQYEQDDLDFLTCYFNDAFNTVTLGDPLRTFFELSVNAFSAFIYAWMSELPIERETVNFARKIIATGDACGGGKEEKRAAAERAANDCGDEDTLAVINAAAKVQNEIHKMMGLLRFFPENDTYISRCAPDHFILPALGDYFSARFGETAWMIIDEKRGLYLNRQYAQDAKILFIAECPSVTNSNRAGDEWEELWRHYHKTINNESRKNPSLQRQFMPKRYWKYLNEV